MLYNCIKGHIITQRMQNWLKTYLVCVFYIKTHWCLSVIACMHTMDTKVSPPSLLQIFHITWTDNLHHEVLFASLQISFIHFNFYQAWHDINQSINYPRYNHWHLSLVYASGIWSDPQLVECQYNNLIYISHEDPNLKCKKKYHQRQSQMLNSVLRPSSLFPCCFCSQFQPRRVLRNGQNWPAVMLFPKEVAFCRKFSLHQQVSNSVGMGWSMLNAQGSGVSMGQFTNLNWTEELYWSHDYTEKLFSLQPKKDQTGACEISDVSDGRQPSTAQRREVKKFPNGFKSGTHEINADGKDRFPINRDLESPLLQNLRILMHSKLLKTILISLISSLQSRWTYYSHT